MVAILGWIMPEPLAKPVSQAFLPPIQRGLALYLGKVSVVRMASAASRPPIPESLRTACLTPPRILGMGKGTPITPVEWTRTALNGTFKSFAARETVFWASFSPCLPVSALAFLVLTTTAWTLAPAFRAFSVCLAGAALTLLVVTKPAVVAGNLEQKSAMSGLWFFFNPAWMPEAR